MKKSSHILNSVGRVWVSVLVVSTNGKESTQEGLSKEARITNSTYPKLLRNAVKQAVIYHNLKYSTSYDNDYNYKILSTQIRYTRLGSDVTIVHDRKSKKNTVYKDNVLIKEYSEKKPSKEEFIKGYEVSTGKNMARHDRELRHEITDTQYKRQFAEYDRLRRSKKRKRLFFV